MKTYFSLEIKLLLVICLLLFIIVISSAAIANYDIPSCDSLQYPSVDQFRSRYPRYFFNTTADARPNVVRIGVHGRRRTAGLLLAVLLRDLFGYKEADVVGIENCRYPFDCPILLSEIAQPGYPYLDHGFLYNRSQIYYYVGNQLNSGCPLEIYNPDSPFPYNIVACNQTHNFSEVLRHSTGTYIHLSRRPVTQRKLLLKQLADRDPALTQFLRNFSLPFTFSMYSPSQVCEWLDYNLLNFVQIRIGLIWPSGFEFDDPSVLEFAELSVGILNSWRCQGNAKDAAFCSLLLSNHQFELVPAGLDCSTSSVLAFYMGLHCSDLSAESASPLAGVVAATCSKTAEPVAQASSRLGTAVVSPTVESPLFNRRDIYPNFYRTVPSYSAYPEVVASFLRKYSWEKLALLTNQKLFYSSLDFNEHLCLVEVVAEKDLTLHRALDSLRRAKKAQCQVIVMDYFRRGTCLYLCAAHQLAMSQRNNYAFILANWAKEIFTDAGANCTGTGALADEFVGGSGGGGGSGEIGGCTNAEITAVSDGHLIVKNYLPPARLAVYRRRLNLTVAKLPSADVFAENHFGVYTSDAIFLLASALGSLYTSDPIYIQRLKSDSVVKLYRKLLENSLSNDDHDFYSRLPVSEGYMMVWLRRYRANGAGYHGRVLAKYRWHSDREQKITVEEIPVDPSESNEAVGFATYDGKFIRPLRADLDCPTAFLMRLLPGWSCLETLAAFCIVLVLLILGCLLMVLFGLLRYCQRRMRRKQSQPFKDIRERLSHKEVAREKVIMNRKIGEGCFAFVYGGEVFLADQQTWEPCAIKLIQEDSKTEDVLRFLEEAEHLSHLSHKNIIRLLAVCTAAEPFLIIMENCLYGDLKSFLMARRTHALCRSDGDTSPELLTQFAIDIASGLEYLHSQDPPVVHRDLALRNCLIHASYTVKIGDFGLARFAPDYYRMSSANAVPMRWMPPEAIQYAFYTVKSDVWAYAVVLYELVTFGKFPFYELSHQQVSHNIVRGATLLNHFPESASTALRALVTDCWRYNPAERPLISEVLNRLQDNPGCVYACLEESPPSQPPEEMFPMPSSGGGGPNLMSSISHHQRHHHHSGRLGASASNAEASSGSGSRSRNQSGRSNAHQQPPPLPPHGHHHRNNSAIEIGNMVLAAAAAAAAAANATNTAVSVAGGGGGGGGAADRALTSCRRPNCGFPGCGGGPGCQQQQHQRKPTGLQHSVSVDEAEAAVAAAARNGEELQCLLAGSGIGQRRGQTGLTDSSWH
ncbi:hypothetical protein BOX15_Mlig004314g1 [Macrostomum lignano]|uniref:Protein kinase domain-containing protein n=1 Tax=Macrostomum lignano TaxID=282301 RepID=A0A267EJE2_9PLAT|nr:hypothetical protein BOX15_Mlig004314g1 [Macrostomum lignano]